MTVAELIAELQKYDPDTEVYCTNGMGISDPVAYTYEHKDSWNGKRTVWIEN